MSEFRRGVIEFLKIIGDPTRLDILDLLKGSEKSSLEIKKNLNKSQSTISKHLNMLYDNHLIEYEKKNNIKYYKIKNLNIFNLFNRINSLVAEIYKEKFKDIRDVDVRDTLT